MRIWHHEKDIILFHRFLGHQNLRITCRQEYRDDSTAFIAIIVRTRLCYMSLIENGSGRPSFGCTCSIASSCWDCRINFGA
ncbi:unnamed protein product [Urochloa humidicola]